MSGFHPVLRIFCKSLMAAEIAGFMSLGTPSLAAQ